MEPQMQPAHVYTAITAVRAALAKEGIAKSRTNQSQNYKFRGIDEMYNTVSTLLAEHNLCIMPSFSERVQVERISDKNKPLFWVSIRGAFAFVSSIDGSSHTVVTYGEAFDSGDKATNKAMSAAMKYALMETFTIPTEGDNDADASSQEVAPYTKAEQEILVDLNTAAAGGMKSLKAEWQKLSRETRDRLRRELEGLAKTAEKNEPKVEPAKEPA